MGLWKYHDCLVKHPFFLFLSPLRPAYGGRDCPGSTFDYQMCNTEECAGPYEDFRSQQCVQRSNKYHKNIKHTWLPYEHPDGKTVKEQSKAQKVGR